MTVVLVVFDVMLILVLAGVPAMVEVLVLCVVFAIDPGCKKPLIHEYTVGS